ncbi:MAG: hypothetical protein JJU19_09190 [Pararhodobacter sp.]|nr:hypothetical protein [Pararhodobacter sp.]
MIQSLDAIARLRELLASLERDMGLNTLSPNERAILYAMQRLSNDPSRKDQPTAVLRTDSIKSHDLVGSMSQPTFNRALKSLIQKNFVSPAPEAKMGCYILGPMTTPRNE